MPEVGKGGLSPGELSPVAGRSMHGFDLTAAIPEISASAVHAAAMIAAGGLLAWAGVPAKMMKLVALIGHRSRVDNLTKC